MLNYDVSKNLGLVGSTTGYGFPTISGLGYNNEGGLVTSQGSTIGITNSVFQQSDIASTVGSLSWTHGIHSYKAGFEIKDTVYSDQSNNGTYGTYNFSGAQTAIPYLGTTSLGSGSLAAPTRASCWVWCPAIRFPPSRPRSNAPWRRGCMSWIT